MGRISAKAAVVSPLCGCVDCGSGGACRVTTDDLPRLRRQRETRRHVHERDLERALKNAALQGYRHGSQGA